MLLVMVQLILENDVEGVDDAGNVSETTEQDVDEQVGGASSLHEDSNGRQEDSCVSGRRERGVWGGGVCGGVGVVLMDWVTADDRLL